MRTIVSLALTALLALGCRQKAPDLDMDGFLDGEDCNDDDASIYPGADELCDGVDNDCDGEVDEAEAVDASTWYQDADADGYGDAWETTVACDQPSGYAAEGTDCDDRDADFHPGAAEDDCTDPNDYNCDGSVGYADADGDGYPACEDCNDASAKINPAATEVCDEVDNDCDGTVDGPDSVDALTFFADADADGYGDAATTTEDCELPEGYVSDDTDCDDAAATTYPGAPETCDLEDDDCDGEVDEDAVDASTWYQDADGDGYGGTTYVLAECEQPTGYVSSADDCDDLDATSHPGGTEVCDEADNDCDGSTDEEAIDQITSYADSDGDGYGDASVSDTSCEVPSPYVLDATDCDDDDASSHPGGTEVCDEADNDCDGATDEDSAVDAATWYADADEDGYGDASSADVACEAPSGYVSDATDCDDTDADANPGESEVCDEVDNDCDGEVDEDSAVDAETWYADMDSDGYGTPRFSQTSCEAPSGYVADDSDCDDLDDEINPDGTEVCDGADNDCDGTADNDEELLGSGEDCPATSCLEILDTLTTAPTDGTFWLEDSAGAYEATCDMTTDGGGFTEISGELLYDRDWVDFDFIDGGYSSPSWDMGWLSRGVFWLDPQTDYSCYTLALRATATLPFTFTEWWGTWSGTGATTSSNQDDVYSHLDWGETTTDCYGHLKFGTDADDSKVGGEWGVHWNYNSPYYDTWSWSQETVTETDVIRWENNDQGYGEDVIFYDVDIWVR